MKVLCEISAQFCTDCSGSEPPPPEEAAPVSFSSLALRQLWVARSQRFFHFRLRLLEKFGTSSWLSGRLGSGRL